MLELLMNMIAYAGGAGPVYTEIDQLVASASTFPRAGVIPPERKGPLEGVSHRISYRVEYNCKCGLYGI